VTAVCCSVIDLALHYQDAQRLLATCVWKGSGVEHMAAMHRHSLCQHTMYDDGIGAAVRRRVSTPTYHTQTCADMAVHTHDTG
jgi:hypothetical protein